MPIIVSGSEGTTIISGSGTTSSGSAGSMTYGSDSISGSTGESVVTGSFIVSGSAFITGTLYVTGNTIYNYGDFYNIGGTISGSSTLEMGGQATFANAQHVMTGTLRVTSSQGIATVYGGGLTRDGSLTLQHSGSQTGILVKNEAASAGPGAVFLSEDSTNGQNQFGLSAPSSVTDSQTMYFPATAGAADQVMSVSSVGGGGGMTTLTMGWADVSSISQAITVTGSITYEPQGLKFSYTDAQTITLTPDGIDGLARIPVANGSVLDMGTLTGSLTCDITTTGVGGLQLGPSEGTSSGYEIRYVSGTSGQGLLMTPETGSFEKPSGYDYASDPVWFVYNDHASNLAEFVDSGRYCSYGGYGPGSISGSGDGDGYSNSTSNFLVYNASNADAMTEFSFDSQVPKNAKEVYVGFRYKGAGGSLWNISLSSSGASGMNNNSLLGRLGTNASADDLTWDWWLNATVVAATGTLLYNFRGYDGSQTGDMFCRGWSF